MKPYLHKASNGHLTIDFGDLSDEEWEKLEKRIVDGWGLERVGSVAVGLDEKIYPSFQRSDFTLATGWDTWSGHYLLAECVSGDDFVRTLYDWLKG